MPFSCLNGLRVARIGMAHDAHAGVGRQDTFQAFGRLGRAISDDDLPGMLAEANANAAPVMETDPGRAADGVDQGIQDRPVGDGI